MIKKNDMEKLMKNKHGVLFGFIIVFAMVILTMAGCDLSQDVEWPTEFRGTWQRLGPTTLTSTRTITATTWQQSERPGVVYILDSISGDSYTMFNRDNRNSTATRTKRIINGNLVISGCTGTGESNCNGTWVRR